MFLGVSSTPETQRPIQEIYKTIIRPMALNASETWYMLKKDELNVLYMGKENIRKNLWTEVGG